MSQTDSVCTHWDVLLHHAWPPGQSWFLFLNTPHPHVFCAFFRKHVLFYLKLFIKAHVLSLTMVDKLLKAKLCAWLMFILAATSYIVLHNAGLIGKLLNVSMKEWKNECDSFTSFSLIFLASNFTMFVVIPFLTYYSNAVKMLINLIGYKISLYQRDFYD